MDMGKRKRTNDKEIRSSQRNRRAHRIRNPIHNNILYDAINNNIVTVSWKTETINIDQSMILERVLLNPVRPFWVDF